MQPTEKEYKCLYCDKVFKHRQSKHKHVINCENS